MSITVDIEVGIPNPRGVEIHLYVADAVMGLFGTPAPFVPFVNSSIIERARIMEYLKGETGQRGLSGQDAATLMSYESNDPVTLRKGMAACLISGKIFRAKSTAPYQKVIGLVYDDSTTPGMAGRVQTDGVITNTALGWDEATGMIGGLSPGSTYYLTPTGAITPFAPTTPGQYVVPVGIALDNTSFRIELNPSILL